VRFSDQVVLTHPLDAVFEAFRDRLPELTPYLPAIESIETVEREELGPGKLKLVNLWQGNRAVAPKGLRVFATPKTLRWKDTAEWDEAERATTWRFETFQLANLYDCHGRNHYQRVADGTRFVLTAELEVYPERVPGVPRFMANKLKPKIEEFVRGRVTDNLAELARGVQAFLDDR